MKPKLRRKVSPRIWSECIRIDHNNATGKAVLEGEGETKERWFSGSVNILPIPKSGNYILTLFASEEGFLDNLTIQLN